MKRVCGETARVDHLSWQLSKQSGDYRLGLSIVAGDKDPDWTPFIEDG